MKKGDKAKLDFNWWKKNKSMRLRSKTFDTVFRDYMIQKKVNESGKGTEQDLIDGINMAKSLEREAKALAGKCGIGQKETKAVLEEYVKLFQTEARNMNTLHNNAGKAAEQALKKIETPLKKVAVTISKINKSMAPLIGNAQMMVDKVGAKQALVNCDTLRQKLKAEDKMIEACNRSLANFAKSGHMPHLHDGKGKVSKVKNFADQTQALIVRAEMEIARLESQINKLATAG